MMAYFMWSIIPIVAAVGTAVSIGNLSGTPALGPAAIFCLGYALGVSAKWRFEQMAKE